MRAPLMIAAAMLAATGRADADEPSDAKRRAAALFAEGRRLASEHDDAGACAKFREAIELDPDAVGGMLNLGACYQNLKKFKTALYWFRKAQARARAANLADSEALARDNVVQVAPLVATVRIRVAGAGASDASVSLDGVEIQPGDYARIEVDRGHHVLEASAAGYKPVELEFDVEGSEAQTFQLVLVARDGPVVTVHEPPPPPPPSDRPRIVLYVAAGGAVSLVAGAAVLIYAKHEYGLCVRDGMALPRCMGSDQAGLAGANYYHNLARWGATPLIGAGIIALGVASYLYVRPPIKHALRTTWTPSVEPGQIGIVAAGSF